MRDALDTPRTWRAKVIDIIVGNLNRASLVSGAIQTCVTAGGLATIGTSTFGFFNNCAGTTECATTAASTNCTSVENPWTAADVGKSIDIAGAGTAGAVHSTTIQAYVGPGQITLALAAVSTVAPTSTSAGGCAVWGDAVVQSLDTTPLTNPDGSRQQQIGVAVVAGNSTLITSSGSNTPRNLANRFSNIYDVKDFGAIGDGIADDTAAINNALIAAGDGGQVNLFKGQFFCTGTINVLAGRTLKGPAYSQGTSGNPGNSNQTQLARPINIISSNAVAINVYAGAAVVNVSVIKSGVVFTQNNTANYANTGIVVQGDDVYILNCAVYGFNQGIFSNGFQRTKIIGVIGDCINGIWINQAYDITTLERCHFWPYVTISSGEPNSNRTGIAYYFSEVADWCRMDKCFAYGYETSFRLKAVSQVRVSNCGADASASLGGTRTGYKVETGTANSSDIVISDSIASYQTYGMDINVPVGEYVTCTGMNIFNVSNGATGIRVNAGGVVVSGCVIAGPGVGAVGISLPSTTYGSIISSCMFRFSDATSKCILNNNNEHTHQIRALSQYGASALYDCPSALEPQLLSPSANNLTLPGFNRNTDTYVVNNSVSAAFNNIVSNNKYPGQVITLIFNNAVTVTSSGTLTLKTSPAAATAPNVMQFVYKGSGYWIEVSRNF